MKILVMESDPHAADDAVAALRRAGHAVATCFEQGLGDGLCRAMLAGDRCPFDAGGVEVALVVREHAWPTSRPRERGVVCALRADVPVVVAGVLALDPYERWEAASVEGGRAVVETCEAARAAATR